MLTDRQIAELATAVVLAPVRRAAISDFEFELIGELGRRFRDHGRDAIITAAERAAFEPAYKALLAVEEAFIQARLGAPAAAARSAA